MTEEVWTTLALITWTQDYFGKRGIEQPRLEAEILLGHVLGWKRIDLYTRFEQRVAPDKLGEYRELVKRRGQHVPSQYLTGSCEFFGLALTVDERVLIPRPETEHLVEQSLRVLKDTVSATVVDLCTGSGAVAAAVAVNAPSVRVLACDLSAEALEVARINVEGQKLSGRVELRQGDLFGALPESLRGKGDLVVANPPYVGEAEFAGLMPEVARHEPRQALVAGPTGLEVVERIITEAPGWLSPGGHLILEVGLGQAGAAVKLASATHAYGPALKIKDYGKIERVIVLTRLEGAPSARP